VIAPGLSANRKSSLRGPCSERKLFRTHHQSEAQQQRYPDFKRLAGDDKRGYHDPPRRLSSPEAVADAAHPVARQLAVNYGIVAILAPDARSFDELQFSGVEWTRAGEEFEGFSQVIEGIGFRGRK